MSSIALSDAFSAAVRESLARLREGEARVRESRDLEGIHLMRTSARRLRSAVKYLGAQLPKPVRRRLQTGLRDLMGALGPARDVDVLRDAIRRTEGLEPQDAARLDAAAAVRLQRALKRMEAALGAEAYPALLSELEAAVSTPGDAVPASRAGASRILAALEDVVALRPTSWEGAEEERLHDLRKSVKRLRYALEAFRPAYGKPVERMIERCRDLQEALGAVQDVAMFSGLLKGVRSFAAGQFLATVRARVAAVRTALPDLWDRAFRGRTARRLGAHLLARMVRPEAPPAAEAPAPADADAA